MRNLFKTEVSMMYAILVGLPLIGVLMIVILHALSVF